MATTFEWDNLNPYIDKVFSLTKNSKNLQRDFLKLVGKETIDYLRKTTPKSSGETSRAWGIEKKSAKSITIGNRNEQVLLYILKGQRGGREVRAKEGTMFRFDIGGQEFFRAEFTTKLQQPRNFMKGVVKNLDVLLSALMMALIRKYWKVFKKRAARRPKDIKFANISKLVALGQGTKRSSLRGRGKLTMVRGRTGRKQFKRRLGRRRRTGKFLTSKEVVMK